MTAGPTDHDAVRDQLPEYAIGALTGAERATVEAHVRDCAVCTAELATFLPLSGALAQIVAQHDPPAALRARVLGSTGARVIAMPARRPAASWLPWLAAAAMLLVTIGVAGYAGSLRERVRALEAQLHDALLRVEDGERRVNVALRAAADAQTPLSILMAPDVRRIDLAGQPVAPAASARTFWSRSRGVVLTAANLPPLPAGRTYQLWFVTAQAPVSVGLLKPDAAGRATVVLANATNLPDPAAVAVTIEPDGGVPAPTGDKYLVGLAH
jgi:anti-sigma-K factor RskA